jgi:hypothetical protein
MNTAIRIYDQESRMYVVEPEVLTIYDVYSRAPRHSRVRHGGSFKVLRS